MLRSQKFLTLFCAALLFAVGERHRILKLVINDDKNR